MIVPRTRKIYTCIKCGARLKQRRKTAMCRPCFTADKLADIDEAIFAAIVTWKRGNDGITPKRAHLVEAALTNDWTVDQALLRLETAGRIRLLQSRAGYRQDGIIVVGGRWTYEGDK